MPNFDHYKRWNEQQKLDKCLVALANVFRFGNGEEQVFGSCCKGLCVKKNYDYISQNAFDYIVAHTSMKSNKSENLINENKKTVLIREHTIPGKVLSQAIISKARELGFSETNFFRLYYLDSKDENVNALKSFILKLFNNYYLYSLILREEDERLNALNLNHTMPEGFSFETSDPLERYNVANIKVIPMPSNWTYDEDKHIITMKMLL